MTQDFDKQVLHLDPNGVHAGIGFLLENQDLTVKHGVLFCSVHSSISTQSIWTEGPAEAAPSSVRRAVTARATE
jgi:hypothetical protein